MKAYVTGVHTEAMDCLQVNLAVLADQLQGAGTSRRLGAALRLPDGEPTAAQRLAEAAELTGLTVTRRWHDVPADLVPEVLRPGGFTYLVADAFDLPWTPYRGHAHLSHSFLAAPDGDGFRVLDAYHNDTPWGEARPLTLTLSRDELVEAIGTAATHVVWLDAGPLPADPGPLVELDPAAIAAYLRPYREQAAGTAMLEQLTLQTWLLHRSRALHADYLGRGDNCVRGWAKLTEQVYLALRRAQRGRPVPGSLLDQLEGRLNDDLTAFGTVAPQPVPADEPSTDRTLHPNWAPFADLVGGVLEISPDRLAGLGSLDRVAACTSMRTVQIVEGLERRFSVSFEADDLAPDRLHDIDHLLALIGRSTEGAAR